MDNPCICGCGGFPRYPGARYVHGHHLRKDSALRLSGVIHARKKATITNICRHCGESFVSKKSHRHRQGFCSRRCQWDAGLVKLKCEWCGEDFVRRKSYVECGSKTGAGRYCSNICRCTFWKARRRAEARPGGHYRKTAYEDHGRKCASCGYEKTPAILVVHHRDGGRTNNQSENLVVLCPNCHAEAHVELGSVRLGPSSRVRALSTSS